MEARLVRINRSILIIVRNRTFVIEEKYILTEFEVQSFNNRRMPNCTTVVQTASDLFEPEIRLNSPKK